MKLSDGKDMLTERHGVSANGGEGKGYRLWA